ncbi:hypothetical protein G6F37_002179 [Rhizopus arrhizus]|nr:hypothetical protein G6F38_002417 [Rhizopus arrhizus]KAG1162401.1 hypothetical protein G6F37_002179 [Rhizopus arrhizus]
MLFSLAITSCLLSLVLAAPASSNSNMAIDISQFKASDEAVGLKDDFVTFNWKKEDGKTLVDRTFYFELRYPAAILVTDFLKGGDVYEISDNGEVIGTTSEAEGDDDDDMYAETPDDAVEEDGFSKVSIPLEKGKHQVTISVKESSNESGSGAVRLTKHVESFYKKDGWKRSTDDDDSDIDEEDDNSVHDNRDWKRDDKSWKYDDKIWKHVNKGDHGIHDDVGEHNQPKATKYYYVYFTDTKTKTVQAHAHDHPRPHIYVNEPVTTIASTSFVTLTHTKFGMLSLPFLTIH